MADQSILELYVDSASVRLSPWTVMLEFGIHEMPPSGETIPRPLLRLRMSPHHAKATALLLTNVMHQYEEVNGPLELHGIEMTAGTENEPVPDDEPEVSDGSG